MNQKDKIEIGKNGLRSYQFITVKKNKVIRGYDEEFGRWSETTVGMFYSKNVYTVIKRLKQDGRYRFLFPKLPKITFEDKKKVLNRSA